MATSRLRHKLERDGAPTHVNFGESFVKAYDERGRRRFHGAFTGGFSAGYFNTVGSKEGWTPSSFRSSRKARATASEQRPEDFMDEEDLAELQRESKLSTTDAYGHAASQDPFAEIVDRSATDTVQASSSQMGQNLLRRMGWKPGQGIGPLVSYAQREHLVALLQSLHLAPPRASAPDHSEATRHKFPPPDTQLVQVADNRDKRGLGSATSSSALQDALQRFHGEKAQRAIGMSGMDSDDEDHVYSAPQDIRDSTLVSRHDTLRLGEKTAPTEAPALAPDQTWHDGRPLIKGFVKGDDAVETNTTWFDPPSVPADWAPDPRRVWTKSEAVPAPEKPRDAAHRGRLLGEAKLPGPPPVITAYLSEQAAKRVQSQAAQAEEAHTRPLTVHPLEPETAVRALEAFVPVGADAAKQARYKAYLEAYIAHRSYTPPEGIEHLQEELDEFYETAQRYRPIQGAMANRFTSSSILQADTPAQGGFLPREAAQPKTEAPLEDATPRTPAQQAAREGAFGDRTRTVRRWNPPRLLCKRLGVDPPPHPEQNENEVEHILQKFGADASAPTAAREPSPAPAFVFEPPSEAAEKAQEAALTEERPSLDLFKAVFASDSEDDEAPAPVPLKRKPDAAKPKKKAKGARVGPLTFDPDDL